jgi:UDP-N-acetylglucosamine 2-epimerase (non-hydrolysing)
MSDVFFKQLGLGEPDHYLGIDGSTHAEVVARIIEQSAAAMDKIKPHLVIVPGDVNSTFACAFAAASLDIPVAHIESGLRSFDMTMPEEKNRILTDRISSLLFVTEPVGIENLEREGITAARHAELVSASKSLKQGESLKPVKQVQGGRVQGDGAPHDVVVSLVGNTIIDALITMMPVVDKSTIIDDLGLTGDYVLFTFHRPVNVDNPAALHKIVEIIKSLSTARMCVFPIHPRTKARMESNGWVHELQTANCKLISPVGYIEFLALMKNAACLVSDSGGVQVESSYLGVPLVTVRDTTECRITIEQGTNTLSALDVDAVVEIVLQKMRSARDTRPVNAIPGLWDGHASERLVEEVVRFLS